MLKKADRSLTAPPGSSTARPPYNPKGTRQAASGWNELVWPPVFVFEGEEKLMPTDVVMPQMGESITEGTITKWLKKPGDTVQRDEPLFEISTDKVDAEIPSPSSGTLKDIKIAEGATVQINTVVCTIEESGSAAATAPAVSPAKAET